MVSESVNGRPWRVFIFGDMGLEYGINKVLGDQGAFLLGVQGLC